MPSLRLWPLASARGIGEFPWGANKLKLVACAAVASMGDTVPTGKRSAIPAEAWEGPAVSATAGAKWVRGLPMRRSPLSKIDRGKIGQGLRREWVSVHLLHACSPRTELLFFLT
jgi:hypothetical protein